MSNTFEHAKGNKKRGVSNFMSQCAGSPFTQIRVPWYIPQSSRLTSTSEVNGILGMFSGVQIASSRVFGCVGGCDHANVVNLNF